MKCDIDYLSVAIILVLLFVVIFVYILILKPKSKEYGSNVIHPQHLGLGAYPPNLYGEPTDNRYYNTDLKAAMRYADGYGAMAGLKFGSFDVNQALGYGKHQEQKISYE